jgi:hypothetical protein
MTDIQTSSVSSNSENRSENDFESGAKEAELSLIAEFILFLRENKAWWMTPILIALALIGVAVWMSGSALAPFIYSIF